MAVLGGNTGRRLCHFVVLPIAMSGTQDASVAKCSGIAVVDSKVSCSTWVSTSLALP